MNNEQKKEDVITLGDIFLALKKHFILLVIITLVVTLIGSVYTFGIAKEKYKSSATLIVAVNDGNSTDITNSLKLISTVAELATEDIVLEKVADKYLETTDEEKVKSYINSLKSTISVSSSTTSFLVTISVTNTDKNLTKEQANLIAESLVATCNDQENEIYLILGNSVQITSRATVGTYVSPNKMLYLIISVLLGGVIACGTVLVIELCSNKFKKKSEIEATTKESIIGELYYQKQGKFSLANEVTDYKQIEPFNKLFTNIKYLNSVAQVKKILVTSTTSGELKTTTISGLALSMAKTGKKVIIVDFDLRIPTLHKVFGVTRNNGLVDYIAGDAKLEDVIKKTVNGIDVITAGTHVENINPLIFIESSKVDELIKELDKQYDYILFDAPPTLPCNDAIILAKKTDGVIYNAAVEVAKKRDFKQCIKNVEESGVNILGVCATRIKISKKEASTYYYYGENK